LTARSARSDPFAARAPAAGEAALAAALVELLAASPAAMARLLELLESHRPAPSQPPVPAYTVASLATALDVSPKVVRGAIARGDLTAVKRGGRWIISADAVRTWAEFDGAARPTPPRRHRAAAERPLGSAIARLGGANGDRRPL
jgi:hypothetical protein